MLVSEKITAKLNLLIVLLICIVSTLSVWLYLKQQVKSSEINALHSVLRQTKLAIEERMAIYIDAHYAATGLFLAKESLGQEVSCKEWRKFVEAMNLVKRYPGINGLGLTKQVEHNKLESFERKIQACSNSEFKIKPYRDRINYFPVTYIEPLDKNFPALGFDMGSEVNRRKAIEKARDTGKPQVTAKITLVQDSERTAGFLSYVPFYSGGEIPCSLNGKRKKFLGHIYAPFIVKDFINGILDIELAELKNSISLEIYDGPKANKNSLIYKNSLDTDTKSLLGTFKLKFHDHIWFVKLKYSPKHLPASQLPNYLVLIIGFIITILLLTIVNTISKTRDQAINIANEMTEELNIKNKLLEKSNEDLNSFAYIASHDLKEPLRTVSNYADLVTISLSQTEFKDEDSKNKTKKFLDNITESCSRMNLMISDILEFSKVSRNRSRFKDLNTNKVIEQSLKDLGQLIDNEEIKIEIAEKLPSIYGNEIEIKRVFQNLLSNALKYRSKTKDPYIKISAEEHQDSNIFTVEDNGIGIDEEYYDQIFSLFKRLHNKEEYPGTGIGLSVCQKIIEHHGGAIWVESTVNEKTCFFIKIPKNLNNPNQNEQ